MNENNALFWKRIERTQRINKKGVNETKIKTVKVIKA
jgi:hypothetical protein